MPRQSIEDRFMSHVKVNNATGCWEWTACINPTGGYGQTRDAAQRKVYAHRLSYELFVGEIPHGLSIDHLCRVRRCVNPKHLEAVPLKVNILRGDSFSAKRAKQTHCKRGHLLAGHNIKPNKNNRQCRTCFNEWRAAKYRNNEVYRESVKAFTREWRAKALRESTKTA